MPRDIDFDISIVPHATNLNLDAMPREALIEFAMVVGGGSATTTWRRAARRLFPDRPKGYVNAASALRNYAWNRATAIRCRERGDIPAALVYETICNHIYDALPGWAKGW